MPNHQAKLFDIYPVTSNLAYPTLVLIRNGERVDEPIPARLSLFLHYLKSRPTKIAKCSQLLVRKISQDCSYAMSSGSASVSSNATTTSASAGPSLTPSQSYWTRSSSSSNSSRLDVYASLIGAKIWLAIVSDTTLTQYERDWQTELITSLSILYHRGRHIAPIHDLVLSIVSPGYLWLDDSFMFLFSHFVH